MENRISDKAYKLFSEMAKNEKLSLTEISGRNGGDNQKEELIYTDITSKIAFSRGDRVLDIGCGASQLAKFLMKDAEELKLSLTFVDAKDVVDRLKNDLKIDESKHKVEFIAGYFPFCKTELANSYDKILMYSMIHYCENPLEVIREGMKLLAPGGALIVGDIPNINKKGRFLSTEFGSRFDCEYRNEKYNGKKLYVDQYEFINKNKSNLNILISDLLITEVIKLARENGFDAYIMDQPLGLPFSYTREDVVIKNGGRLNV